MSAPHIDDEQAGEPAGAAFTRDALSDAIEHLTQTLGSKSGTLAAKGLAATRAALRRHRLEVSAPRGLYGEVQADAPWLIPRIRRLHARLDRIEVELAEDAPRRLLERALRRLRLLMAEENHLVLERWNEPAALD